MIRSGFLTLLLASAAPSALAMSQLHVVDPAGGPGSDFTDVQVAIDAAQDGDVLLLRSGSHGAPPPFGGGINIDGKGLSLIEEAQSTANIDAIRVENLASNQRVVLRGFDFYEGAALTLVDCAGIVWVEDCHFSFNLNGSFVGLTATDCDSVHVNRCTFECAQFVSGPGQLTYRVSSIASNVHLYETSVQGCSVNPFAPTAMDAVLLWGGSAFIAGSTLLGGNGCEGSGLFVLGGHPEVEVLDSTILAGDCLGGTTPDIDLTNGTVIQLPDTARFYEVNSPVRSGEQVEMVFRGVPGDLVFLDVSGIPGSNKFPITTGVWQLDFPYVGTFIMGTVPATGALTVTFGLGPVASFWQLFTQADFLDPVTATLTLAGGSELLGLAN